MIRDSQVQPVKNPVADKTYKIKECCRKKQMISGGGINRCTNGMYIQNVTVGERPCIKFSKLLRLK
jgi:hypothetical protein